MSNKISKNTNKNKKQARTDIEDRLVLYAGLSIVLCVTGLIVLAMVLSHTNVSYINELISHIKY